MDAILSTWSPHRHQERGHTLMFAQHIFLGQSQFFK